MAIYTGTVIANASAEFPFVAIVKSDDGKFLARFPARTEALARVSLYQALARMKAVADQ